MVRKIEIDAAAEAMFVCMCSNADPRQTWREIKTLPQYQTTVGHYEKLATFGLAAAERVRVQRRRTAQKVYIT